MSKGEENSLNHSFLDFFFLFKFLISDSCSTDQYEGQGREVGGGEDVYEVGGDQGDAWEVDHGGHPQQGRQAAALHCLHGGQPAGLGAGTVHFPGQGRD